MANFKAVGCITGSPLTGLCERMCINADCVIDGCRSRRNGQSAMVALSDFSVGAVAPFTFVGAQEMGGSEFIVNSVCPAGGTCRNVSGVLRIPISVQFTDANGVCGYARGTIELSRQLMLRVPQNSLGNYRFEGSGVIISTSGAFISDSVISLTFCIVETYKTVVNADILVPTYGFAAYPDCRECGACNRLMNSEQFSESD